MSRRGLMDFTLAVFVMTGTLAAQDPLFACRSRAAVLANVPSSGISAQRRGGLANGNDIILWAAKLANGKTVTGFCEANPRNGRIVRLDTDQGDSKAVNRTYRITPADAERVCQREARARFSPGNGMIGATFLENISTNSTYRVGWQYNNLARTIRTGQCVIDSATGTIRRFKSSISW